MTKENVRQDLALAMAAGAAMGRITMSSLMCPSELERIARGRPELEGKLPQWCVCTEVPDAMWHPALVAYGQGVPSQIVVARSPSGRPYIIVAVSAEGWQHRVCIPLLGKLTAQWLQSLRGSMLMTMSIANAATHRTFLTESVIPPAALVHLSDCDPSVPADPLEFLEEAFTLVAWNAAGGRAGPVSTLREAEEVSVSLLMPAEVEARLEQLAEGRAGRKAN